MPRGKQLTGVYGLGFITRLQNVRDNRVAGVDCPLPSHTATETSVQRLLLLYFLRVGDNPGHILMPQMASSISGEIAAARVRVNGRQPERRIGAAIVRISPIGIRKK